ncbi:MAG: BON domain-containing protein [Acidobacteriia bacterium]|nr:BON domain-containing protein [Terriglobia bacterium]
MQKRIPIQLPSLLAAGLLALSICTMGVAEAVFPLSPQEQKEEKTPQLRRGPSPQKLSAHSQVLLADEVRHQLLMLPYYGVFDWLQGEVLPDGRVVLRGEAVKPTTKSDSEARVKKIEGVRTVDNRIEVLPLSSNDDKLRIAVYRAIFSYDSPLFTQYAIQAVPPIHIVVKNGRVTLKGIVAREMDGQLAYTAARSVPGIFEVTNELQMEESPSKEKPKKY